jgi:hypothetical protein
MIVATNEKPAAPACYAVFDRASRRVVSFQWAGRRPTLPGHPELDCRLIAALPAFRAGGYAFDPDFNLIET